MAAIDVAVRFEAAPGLQAHVDFAEFRLPWGTRFALLVVTNYSTLLWMQFYPLQTMSVLTSGLEQGLHNLGGCPAIDLALHLPLRHISLRLFV